MCLLALHTHLSSCYTSNGNSLQPADDEEVLVQGHGQSPAELELAAKDRQAQLDADINAAKAQVAFLKRSMYDTSQTIGRLLEVASASRQGTQPALALTQGRAA